MVYGHTVYKLFCYSWNVLSSVCFVICFLFLFFWSDLYVLAGNYCCFMVILHAICTLFIDRDFAGRLPHVDDGRKDYVF